ncbi:hypothetical protein [Streptomyces xanthochromogenes]|uniref:hypothetical protein n=1 Tax=Streptomyces xanthochromogenes TaxID=67384 RepID=UPI00342FC8AA
MLLDRPLSFHRLSFVPDGDGVLVGRPDTDDFAVLPPDGAAALRRMTEGHSPAQAAAWYAEHYGEQLDMADFLDTLGGLGFLRGADEPDPRESGPDAPVRFQRLARAVFSRPALGCYGLLVAAWLAAIATTPDLAPHPGQVFWTDSLLLVQLVVVFGQLPFVGLHEACHVLAGRRLGLPSELGMGTRLYIVVFETRMNGLLTVERRKRYLPFLAGMLIDLVVVSALGLTAFWLRGPDGAEPAAGRLLLAMAFPILIRCGYQLFLFLETDVYYVFATALGCHDLHAATRALVLNRLRRLARRPGRTDLTQWTERDLAVARWYAPFFTLGVAVLLALAPMVFVPLFVRTVQLLADGISSAGSGLPFWDSLVFAALNLVQIAFWAWLTVRVHVRRRRTARGVTS